jgi:peptidoglycan/LPS O-acetylase OafA/YrhL
MVTDIGQVRRIDDVEVLRAVAIAMTLIGHSSELLFWGGRAVVWSATSLWGGVDLFFCISGYVIARSLIEEVPRSGGGAAFLKFAIPFWIKRIFRIWPAAFLWIGIALLLASFFNRTGSFGPLRANLADALAAVLQVANLHYLDCLTFKNGDCYTLMGIYWSLSLEEQFYILFPFLLFLVPGRFLIPLLVAGVAVQLPLSRPPWSPFWAIRSDTLMLGVLIALVQIKPVTRLVEPVFLGRSAVALVVFGSGVFLICVIPFDPSVVSGLATDRPFVWFSTGLLSIVCAVLVFIASFGRSYTFPEGRAKRLLVYVGTRSYALYLVHNPLFFATREIFHDAFPRAIFNRAFTLPFIVTAACLTMTAAELTYRFVETPLRRFGRRKAAEYRLAHLPQEVPPCTGRRTAAN